MKGLFERLFLIPFIGIGIVVAGLAYYSWAMLLYPTTTTGTIVSHEKKWDSEDGYIYYLYAAFDRDGQKKVEHCCVSKKSYDEIKDGTTCGVIYTRAVPNSGAELDLPERRNLGIFFTLFITFFAVCWNAITWAAFFLAGRSMKNSLRPTFGYAES